jgi:pilus assembly protein Flp/PilA
LRKHRDGWALFKWLRLRCRRSAVSESGVTAIEYGLIAALIAVAIITAVTLVGTRLATLFTTISGKL